jgi:hypothetical protein
MLITSFFASKFLCFKCRRSLCLCQADLGQLLHGALAAPLTPYL